MQIKARLLSILALSFAAAAGPASATTIQTVSYSAWVASLSGSPSESNMYFGSASYSNASGWSTTIGTYGSFTATGSDNGAYFLNRIQGYGSSGSITGLVGPSDGGGGITLTAPSGGVTGILLGLGLTGNSAPITVTLSDGETFTVSPSVNGNAFIGLSSSIPITSVFLSTSSGSAIVLDDLWAGLSDLPTSAPSSATSECATILLISGGLVFLGAKRKIFSNVTASRA